MLHQQRLILPIAALFAANLYGQVAGRVVGAVVDATGAGIPGATVTLNLSGASSAAYTTKTGTGGDFTLPTVNPVTYDLVVEMKGFLTFKIAGVKVDSGSS